MKKSQAKGYLLEIVLAKLLKVNGYDLVTSSDNEIRVLERNGLNVKGRGGYHQFDSLGTFRITPPFVYPNGGEIRNVPNYTTICISYTFIFRG